MRPDPSGRAAVGHFSAAVSCLVVASAFVLPLRGNHHSVLSMMTSRSAYSIRANTMLRGCYLRQNWEFLQRKPQKELPVDGQASLTM